jgi:predicted  nucleic acid-binding Zn-ribbon protein
MTSDQRTKQLEDQVAQLLAFKQENETRMLTMKHKILDLEREVQKLKQPITGQRPQVQLGDLG